MKTLIAVLFLLIAPGTASAQSKLPYSEGANAKADIEAALKIAGGGGKRVLIVFGANWCGDCRMLDQEMQKPDLANVIAGQFVVVKVDVGRFKRNRDISVRYGDVTKNGIPAVVILRPDASVAFRTEAGELSDARKMGAAGIAAYFAEALTPAM